MSSSNPPAASSASGQTEQPPSTMQPSPLHRGEGGGGGDADNKDKDNNKDKKYDAQTQLVLDFLKQKGMTQAALELTQKLDAEQKEGASGDNEEEKPKTARERFQQEDEKMRAQRTLLHKTTGGGYGYDRDAAFPVVQWAVPDTRAAAVANSNPTKKSRPELGVEEARAMLDAFCHVQLWVLNLPDGFTDGGDDEDIDGTGYDNVVMQPAVENPILRAQKAILQDKNQSVEDVVKLMVSQPPASAVVTTTDGTTASAAGGVGVYNLPPSVKPELLSVTFALFVHTYADLLEVGMETTAHQFRNAFAPIYQPLFPNEFRDLEQCTTTEGMMRLHSHNASHMEAVSNLKHILVQVSSYQLRKDEHLAHLQSSSSNNNTSAASAEQQFATDPKIKDCDKKISILQSKYKELSLRATQFFDKMHDLPFLRRARATRWMLTLSTSTYALLTAFLANDHDSLLTMSTLLQTKCALQIEQRDPLPYTPACVLLETGSTGKEDGKKDKEAVAAALSINETGGVNWAVPAPRQLGSHTPLPFPQFHLKDEYETEHDAAQDEQAVAFNRALLVNGFRRLQALERKREYQVLTPLAQKRARQQHQAGTSLTQQQQANPLEPSILLSTLSSSSAVSGAAAKAKKANAEGRAGAAAGSNSHLASIWEEPGMGLCCAQVCRLGRRVAAGCDDAAVRIYDLERTSSASNNSCEPCQVLVGHKNGFPVFDVDWNRDGRALLSCGGDGSVRLWDTMAVGPFGETTTPKGANSSSGGAGSKANDKRKGGGAAAAAARLFKDDILNEMDMAVPGWKAPSDPVAYTSGCAIAVYRGHAPNTAVWSVAFAPCGYYFLSGAADATARIWTTDRPMPVRLLSGHTSQNVNCVNWHPNANYVVTGSDDKTARLWDVQTGQTVRLLTGATAGLNAVEISPGGQYCAGADYAGAVHLWDLGTGKKLSVLRSTAAATVVPTSSNNSTTTTPAMREQNMLHALSFSACGNALAVGGDDCTVRIWDLQQKAMAEADPVRRNPHKTFPTRRTVVMDLHYTKRNLLLGVGKYVSPVPVVVPAGPD